MNTLHLRYFYEVAKTKSFMEASRNLRISQPAISKMVGQLEADLGSRLMERTRRGIVLTESGELLFTSASKVFSEIALVEDSIKNPQMQFVGEWTLGISENLAIHIAPKLVGEFKDRHPDLKIGLFAGTSSQIKHELMQDRCRVGIFFTPLKKSEQFESKIISETEFWIVISAKNRWISKKSITIQDLKEKNVPRIESRHSDYSGGFPAHFHSIKLGFNDRPWIETNQHEVKKNLVLGGYGFSLLTKHTVENEVEKGKLIRVGGVGKLEAPIYAVWRKERGLDRISEEFLRGWGRR